ncbi:hypothetical protein HDV00_003487 [Rhizophlyctis rosea]|nr:hypothetical protein HDV00_003487 [Rhizophlyctis rosea]
MAEKSTPKFELIYFKIWGLGEIPRLVFECAGVEFVNSTLEWNHWMAEEKAKAPFHKLPLLKVTQDNGSVLTLAQSQAIVRYLGKNFGLAGETLEDQAQADMILEEYMDFTFAYLRKFGFPDVKDNIKDRPQVESFLTSTVLPFIKSHERFLASSNSAGHYVGNSITIADIAAYQTLNWVTNTPYGSVLTREEAPHTWKVYETVAANENIKAYVESERRFRPWAWQTKVEGQVEL